MFNGFNLDTASRRVYSKDPNKIFWLMDTSYGRNQAHTLHFIAEDGQEKRISIRDTFPFFYVRNTTKQAVDQRIEFLEKKHLVQGTETVMLINPKTREKERIVKVLTYAPKYVTNQYNPNLAVSHIFKDEYTHNNHVAYHNIILNDTGFIMGMPYRFRSRIPELVLDGLEDNRELYKKVFKILPPEAKEVGESVFQQIHAVLPNFSRMLAACDVEIQANFAESVDPVRAEVPITSIAVKTHERNRVFVLDNESLENDPPADPSVFEDDTFEKIIFDSEKKLLIACLDYIKNIPQRLLVWFFGDGFDVIYISRRLELHGLKDYYGIEGYPLKTGYHKRTYFTKWEGKIVLDLLPYFDNQNVETGAYLGKYENKKLDTIAKGIIGVNKYDYEGTIESLSSEELAFYNAKDAQITYDLATHDNDFPAFILFFIMRFSNLSLPKANRQGITSWWSGFQFRNHHKQNTFYPNRWMVTRDLAAMGRLQPEKLAGGDVLDAVMGVWNDISILDFSSLYPTNIILNNICYSTINCDHPECQLGQPTANGIEIPEGIMWTCKRHLGFMTAAMMFFREARVKIYKPRGKKTHPEYSVFYNAIAQFFKIFMNAAYGCYKNPGFAFFHILAAQAVTASSRDKLSQLTNEIIKLGGKVVGGDSVAGPEPVIVKIDEANPFIMSLENLWDTMENRFESHSYEQTKERIPVNGLKVWDGQDWNTVRALIKHATYKTMHRISTGLGVVDVTSDHSLVSTGGEMLRPVDIGNGKEPFTEIFSMDNVSPLTEEESLTQLLFCLFSLSGTASHSMSIYNSQRTLAVHAHNRYAHKVVQILELCAPIIKAFGSSYKVYRTENKRSRTVVKFRSHVGLWQAVRDNCYIEDEKLRPVKSILGLTDHHQKVIYDYMKDYYYKPPKKGGDRWRFSTNVELQAFSILANRWDRRQFTFYPLPRGNTYHAKYSSKMSRMTKVTELKVAAEHVFDLETEDGTFMVSNIKCHNTDSVFSADVLDKFAELLSEALGMEVENEGTWDKMIVYKKKNYILLKKKNGTIVVKIKGMVGKKKSTVPMIRTIYDDCVKSFELEMTNQDMLDHIYERIKLAEQKIKNGKFNVDEVQLSKTLNKDLCGPRCKKPCGREDHYKANTPTVQAAKTMVNHLEKSGIKSNSTFGRKGVVVDFIKTRDGWTPTVLVKADRVDTEYLIGQLHSVFDQLTPALGVDKVREGELFDVYRLKQSKETHSLEEWF